LDEREGTDLRITGRSTGGRWGRGWALPLLFVGLLVGKVAGAEPMTETQLRLVAQWGYVGVYLGDLPSDRTRWLGLETPGGAIVGKVEPGSPAERAGLREEDYLLTLDGEPILNRLAFFQRVMTMPPGSRIRLGLIRSGAPLDVEVDLGGRRPQGDDPLRALFNEADAMLVSAEEYSREAKQLEEKGDLAGAAAARDLGNTFRELSAQRRAAVEQDLQVTLKSPLPPPNERFSLPLLLGTRRYQLGLGVVALSDQLASYFQSSEGGVLVSEVRPGGAAERAGIRAGDCLTGIDHRAVSSPTDLTKLLDEVFARVQAGSPLAFPVKIVRDRLPQLLEIRL
jgi:S1-C subfamily serine protease